MDIEYEIFKYSKVDFKKLEKYGFKENNGDYLISKKFMNDDFKANVTIDKSGNVFGTVIDLNTSLEYENLRVEKIQGSFVNQVREEYKNILIDIKKNCFKEFFFQSDQANMLCDYITKTYGSNPEFLWKKYPNDCIFRNNLNKKWFALIMGVDKSKFSLEEGEVEIINLKCNDIDNKLNKKGYYRAYHMNKKKWITAVLDGTISTKELIKMIEESYNIVNTD